MWYNLFNVKHIIKYRARKTSPIGRDERRTDWLDKALCVRLDGVLIRLSYSSRWRYSYRDFVTRTIKPPGNNMKAVMVSTGLHERHNRQIYWVQNKLFQRLRLEHRAYGLTLEKLIEVTMEMYGCLEE